MLDHPLLFSLKPARLPPFGNGPANPSCSPQNCSRTRPARAQPRTPFRARESQGPHRRLSLGRGSGRFPRLAVCCSHRTARQAAAAVAARHAAEMCELWPGGPHQDEQKVCLWISFFSCSCRLSPQSTRQEEDEWRALCNPAEAAKESGR